MKISELINLLEKVKLSHGDLEVRAEINDDNRFSHVCVVNHESDDIHVRLTDDVDSLYYIYDEDQDDTEIIVEEIK